MLYLQKKGDDHMFSNLIFIIFWSTLFALLAESMEVLHFFVVDDKIEGPELIHIFGLFANSFGK